MVTEPALRNGTTSSSSWRLGDRVRFLFGHFPIAEKQPRPELAAEAAEAAKAAGAQGGRSP